MAYDYVSNLTAVKDSDRGSGGSSKASTMDPLITFDNLRRVTSTIEGALNGGTTSISTEIRRDLQDRILSGRVATQKPRRSRRATGCRKLSAASVAWRVGWRGMEWNSSSSGVWRFGRGIFDSSIEIASNAGCAGEAPSSLDPRTDPQQSGPVACEMLRQRYLDLLAQQRAIPPFLTPGLAIIPNVWWSMLAMEAVEALHAWQRCVLAQPGVGPRPAGLPPPEGVCCAPDMPSRAQCKWQEEAWRALTPCFWQRSDQEDCGCSMQLIFNSKVYGRCNSGKADDLQGCLAFASQQYDYCKSHCDWYKYYDKNPQFTPGHLDYRPGAYHPDSPPPPNVPPQPVVPTILP